MPQTRAASKADEKGESKNDSAQAAGSKRKQPAKEKKDDYENEEQAKAGRTEEKHTKTEPPSKAQKQAEPVQSADVDKDKLDSLLESYGELPLFNYGLTEPETATPSNLLAHLLNAMLTSARISNGLAAKSVRCLIEANYHNLETLKKSSWDERTEVLTKGGYTRYREKTATGLGELAEFLSSKYEGDLNRLRGAAGDDAQKVRELVKEVKGIGEVGVNIFHDSVQALWPCMAPYVDPRSFDTAEGLGVGKDVQAMWKGVGKDPVKMARLCQALTTVRLQKKEEEFED